MRVSAKADYAVRACAELAASPQGDPVRADDLAVGQQLPVAFLERILGDLRRGDVVTSVRGRSGGYRLARPADEITLADIIRAVDGPLVTVRDERPTALEYAGSAQALLEVWVALRVSVRDVLDQVTLAGLVSGELPPRSTSWPPATTPGSTRRSSLGRRSCVALAAARTAAGRALTMRSTAASSCAAETNQASNGEGGA